MGFVVRVIWAITPGMVVPPSPAFLPEVICIGGPLAACVIVGWWCWWCTTIDVVIGVIGHFFRCDGCFCSLLSVTMSTRAI